MVKPARAAGERVGKRESVGRRQNRMPGGLIPSGISFSERLLEQRMEPTGVERHRPQPEGRAIGKIASQHAVLGNRRVDGQARAGSGRASGKERLNRTSPE